MSEDLESVVANILDRFIENKTSTLNRSSFYKSTDRELNKSENNVDDNVLEEIMRHVEI